jgi:hypothetical protein
MVDFIIFVPETYTRALLEGKARRLRKETDNDKFYAQSEVNKPTMYQLYKISLSRCTLLHES